VRPVRRGLTLAAPGGMQMIATPQVKREGERGKKNMHTLTS